MSAMNRIHKQGDDETPASSKSGGPIAYWSCCPSIPMESSHLPKKPRRLHLDLSVEALESSLTIRPMTVSIPY